ncbi:signal peptidase I [Candidatus Methanoperedens nitroreducens]|uniref:Signal peptidase I n=1 Tax=Candidatus Methanoperedens nitratireducens TaxID=1392998 RepID=A0A062V0A5_9EURY|nr:signal peptidase I [Candidatus Methanoperedens nitroreducens]KCZ70822.1 signal peptidase I [Candidatus Methanoperedens nitroreducens]MDJ1420677.1 signal peptidase I [Candidatus Methanoperedens sp.]
MVLDQIIPESIISILKDLTETRAFYLTMVYPAATSIIAGITFYLLITRQKFTYPEAAKAIKLLTKTWEYLKRRQNEAKIRYISKSMEKKRILRNTVFFEMGSLVLSGTLIILILTKTLFLAMVTTQSMAPLIMPGDLIVTEALTKNITVGDVIVFIPPDNDMMYVHRVTSVSENEIRTKGDNALPDTWRLTKDNIKGKAISLNQKPIVIKGLGYYFMPIDNPIRAQDPTLKAIRGNIQTMQTYGPLISIMIILFVLLTMIKK